MNRSEIEINPDGSVLHKQLLVEDIGPVIEENYRLKMANMIRKRGWSDGRLMKLNARIPAIEVWKAEHQEGFNLSDPKDYHAYLMLHPEYLIAPIDTGASGKVIVKGE